MKRRQPPNAKANWPNIWLMTDQRFGDDLLPAVRRLPSGSGVIFRHYHLDDAARRRLFGQLRKICGQRGHMLFLAGSERKALHGRADGFHARAGRRRSLLPRSAAVHNRTELREAMRNRADLVFISPIFATGSHPDSKSLGRLAFNALAKQARQTSVIALGGMDARRALNPRLAHGWAAIDAFRKKPR
jgi:thiamine-phosphate pyrophosphorylase